MSSSTQVLTRRAAAAGAAASTPAAKAAAAAAPLVSKGGVVVDRVPTVKPPFTVGDIKAAIPAHCFSRPLSKSFGYLLGDCALVAMLYFLAGFIPLYASDALLGAVWGPWVRGSLWVAYWLAQGFVLTGLWVIGHECGHGGFADAQWINDVVGLVVHSLLLVPYFAWQISHRRHHSNTGSVEHDEVFVPRLASKEEQQQLQQRRAAAGGAHHHDEDEGFVAQTVGTLQRLFMIVVMLTLGWPAYLAYNVTGNLSYDPRRWVNHFAPKSPIFTSGGASDARNQQLILVSDVALIAVGLLFAKWVQLTSFSHFLFMYFLPYLVVNAMLVLITYLQHTDLNLPHYTDGEWDWLRGALATVDRDYGLLNSVLHHITDTHVVHHLFSYMPHYHAEEATRAVKGMLGDYYRYDSTPVHVALWNSFRDCISLHPDPAQKGVHWFEPQ